MNNQKVLSVVMSIFVLTIIIVMFILILKHITIESIEGFNNFCRAEGGKLRYLQNVTCKFNYMECENYCDLPSGESLNFYDEWATYVRPDGTFLCNGLDTIYGTCKQKCIKSCKIYQEKGIGCVC